MKRRRRLIWLSVILGGLCLGTAGGAWMAAWALKSHVRSPEFLKSVSHELGVELKAASLELELMPPSLEVTGLEAWHGSQKLASIAKARLSLSLSKLLILEGAVRLEADDAILFVDDFGGTGGGASPFANLSLPQPLRRLELNAFVHRFKPPQRFAPQTDVALEASLSANADAGVVLLDLRTFQAFGVEATGQGRLEGNHANFTLTLPTGKSLVAGQVSGEWSTSLKLKGELKLPGTTVTIPPDARWMIGASAVDLKGRARLAGGLAFDYDSAGRWSGQGSIEASLTEAAFSSEFFEKRPGQRADLSGRFEGNSESAWALRDLRVSLGGATALVDVESVRGAHTRVAGKIEPFEIGEFAPLFLKGTNASGRARLNFELALADSAEPRPSGVVELLLEEAVIDGRAAARLVGLPARFQVGGPLKIDAHVKTDLKDGAFKTGTALARVNATEARVEYSKTFKKRVQYPLVIDLEAGASGQTIDVQALRVALGSGARVRLKGSIKDLKQANASLQLIDSRVDLRELSQLVPGVEGASGLLRLSGSVQGALLAEQELFVKLESAFKGLELAHENLHVSKASGQLELIASRTEVGHYGFLLRTGGLSAILDPGLPGFAPVAVKAEGKINYGKQALSGAVSAVMSAVDLSPLLHRSQAPPTAATDENVAEASPLDLAHSNLAVTLTSPSVRLSGIEFRDARAKMKIGADGKVDGPDFSLERLGGKALGGELSIRGSVAGERVKFSGRGTELAMPEVMRVVQKTSGKTLAASVSGRGDVEVDGVLKLQAAGGPSDIEAQGSASIKDGSFKFLPAPRGLLDQLKRVPVLSSKLPLDKDSGEVIERFEKAQAKYRLQGERLGLEIDVADPLMTMRAAGHVTLSGHCELDGTLLPKDKLVGPALASAFAGGVPFESRGENFECGFTPRLEVVATRLAKAKLTEKLDEGREKLGTTLIKGLGKGLFGK